VAEKLVRIGELARRTGVSPDLLRAWERRYGVLAPVRSAGNFRLYSAADEARIDAMSAHLGAGVPAREAARLVLAEAPRPPDPGDLAAAARELRVALDGFDESRAHAALDVLLSGFGFETLARDVLLPYLRDLGERWEQGKTTVAHEHFASGLLRGRLLGLARGWDRGVGPRALLACAPGELHDLGLIVFGLALREEGWRVTYLGPDTPPPSLAAAARTLRPAAVVVVTLRPERLVVARDELSAVAREAPVWLAGAVAHGLAEACGARLLRDGPLAAARELSRATAA
jgi:DNA-binding transcriptional MerR regulator